MESLRTISIPLFILLSCTFSSMEAFAATSKVTAGPATLGLPTVNGSKITLTWKNSYALPDGGFDIIIDNVDTNTKYRTKKTTATIGGLDLTVGHCFQLQSRYSQPLKYRWSQRRCTSPQKSNQSPVISGSPARSVTAGKRYSFTPTASDPDSNKLSFAVKNLPRWATFDTKKGTLTGTPSSSDAGVYSGILIRVSDGSNTTSLASFNIRVDSNVKAVGFANTTASVKEGSAVKVRVNRSNSVGKATVLYGTHGVTAVSSTRNGDDYKGFDPIAVTFADGETSKVVSVQTLDNAVLEGAETFEIYLRSPSTGYKLNSNSVVTVKIVDNDNAPVEPDKKGSTTLSWAAPSTRADGTSLSMNEIDGYRIYMGDTKSDIAPVMDINDNSLTKFTLSNLSIGKHYFAVTAYDTSGNESEFSNILSKSAR